MKVSVGLAAYNSKDIAWLAMESMCNQKGIDFEWELIIMEEKNRCFGEENFAKYCERLAKIGCVSVRYYPLDYRIGLPEKWRSLANYANSDVFVFWSADDYQEPNKIKKAHDLINKGHDWVGYNNYLLYDINSGRNLMFDAKSRNWSPAYISACRTKDLRRVPDSSITSGVDYFIYNSINPKNKFIDYSDDWKQGFCTDGMNNISKTRARHFLKPESPFFPTDLDAKNILPQIAGFNKKPECVLSHNVEFGYELISALPYAYKLFKEGRLLGTESAVDTECLYFFSPKHKINKDKRSWSNMPKAKNVPNIKIHKPDLDWTKFEAPPLKDTYKNDRFVFEKPIICICNRVNIEWGRDVINYFDLECLENLFKMLYKKYQIVYFNIEGRKEFYDGVKPVSIGDFDLARKYGVVIHDLHKENKDLSFNTLQLMIMANCEAFITMNGGYSILASYMGGTNIIYSKECKEINNEVNSFYKWYHKFGGSRIVHVDNYEDLTFRVKNIFVDKNKLVNFLVRSHNRPEHFKRCYDAILSQTHKNVNIIAGADNEETAAYLQPYKIRQVRYSKSDYKPDPKEGYGDYFPHNNYINILNNEVNDGWVILQDDDDMMNGANALKTIVSHIKDENSLILWKVRIDKDYPAKNFGKKPVMKDISGCGFMCHSKHLKGEIFTPYRRADFRLISALYEKLNPIWIDEVLVKAQDGRCNHGKEIEQLILT